VPPSAISKRPRRDVYAPVNAPFSWPKSSLSSSSAGMAPQLTATKALPRRGLLSWMALATTSLPVPDSPSTRTLESCAATLRINEPISRIAIDFPLGTRAENPALSELTTKRALSGRLSTAPVTTLPEQLRLL